MQAIRILFFLLALMTGGLAHASLHAFDNAPRASDEELDRMRGGFVVSWNGQEFLMPFSIDGIERLTQINGQTFINGELMSARVNPQALIPFTQNGQVSVNVPTQPPISAEPPVASQASGLPDATGGVSTQADRYAALPWDAQEGPSTASASTDSGIANGSTPASLAQTTSGAEAIGTTQSAGNGNPDTTSPASTNTENTQVTMRGSQIIFQNGSANAIVLPTGASLNSLGTIIQNSVNDQIIRNITTLNITLEAQQLAAQARLNAILNQRF